MAKSAKMAEAVTIKFNEKTEGRMFGELEFLNSKCRMWAPAVVAPGACIEYTLQTATKGLALTGLVFCLFDQYKVPLGVPGYVVLNSDTPRIKVTNALKIDTFVVRPCELKFTLHSRTFTGYVSFKVLYQPPGQQSGKSFSLLSRDPQIPLEGPSG